MEWVVDPGLVNPPNRAWFAQRAERAIAELPVPASIAGRPRVDLGGSLLVEDGEARVMFEAEARSGGLGVPIKAGLVAAGPGGNNDEIRVVAEQGLADLMSALGAMLALVSGDSAAWIRALESAEPDEQVLAARLLARDRVREAIPAIGKLLGDPRAAVAEAAADALAAIGDQAAVPVLIGSISRGDLRSEVRVIEALGRIGGPEAEAYLEMTAGGHEVGEVRRLSEDALRRLRKRGPSGDSL